MDRPWLASYPESVPTQIDISEYHSVVDILTESTSRFADRPAFQNLGATITYHQLEQYTQAFASWCSTKQALSKAIGLRS